MFLDRAEIKRLLDDLPSCWQAGSRMRHLEHYIKSEWQPCGLLEVRIRLAEEFLARWSTVEDTGFMTHFMQAFRFDWEDMRGVNSDTFKFDEQSEQYRNQLFHYYELTGFHIDTDDLRAAMRLMECWLRQAHDQNGDEAEAEFNYIAGYILNYAPLECRYFCLIGQNFLFRKYRHDIVQILIVNTLILVMQHIVSPSMMISIWCWFLVIAGSMIIAILIPFVLSVSKNTSRILSL